MDKVQTEGKMQTEDWRPGEKCRLGSKTTLFPRKTSRVSWDRGRTSGEMLVIVLMAIDVLNFTSSNGFGVEIMI